MTREPSWREWELYLQRVLSLDDCIASGAKWYDLGDGVTREHYLDSVFPMVIDAKYTDAKSFSVTEKMVSQWLDKALDMGKRFLLPIRFGKSKLDLVVMSLEDFSELLADYRRLKLEERSKTVSVLQERT